MKGAKLIFGIICAGVFVQVAAGTIIIDDFLTAQGPLSLTYPADVGTTVSSEVAGAGILGGARDIEVALVGGSLNGTTISAVVASFAHQQGPGITGTSTTVWDGTDGNGSVIDYTGLGGVDLTEGGLQDAFELSIPVEQEAAV